MAGARARGDGVMDSVHTHQRARVVPAGVRSPHGEAPWPPVVRLGGIRLHAVTEAEAVRHVLDELGAGRGGWVVTHNLDHLRRLAHDEEFAAMCAEATLAVADGMPLVWASRLQGTPLPQRVAGSNLIWSLTAAAAKEGRSVFLLGGAPGTAERAGGALRNRFPALRLAGTHCPPMGFEMNPGQVEELAHYLTAARPQLVFVALGSPKQERIIHALCSKLPAAWWVGVGISFSFACGHVRRAPRWMQHIGLEWTHRLLQEPRRLARRYLIEGIPFAGRLLAVAAWEGMHARLRPVGYRR